MIHDKSDTEKEPNLINGNSPTCRYKQNLCSPQCFLESGNTYAFTIILDVLLTYYGHIVFISDKISL